MSYNITWNFQDTSITAVGNIQPASLAYKEDFGKLETVANESLLTNKTASTETPETIRFATTRINNVYSGAGLSPAYFSQNKSGTNMLAQLHTTITAVDTETNTREDLPLSAHIVLKVPNHAAITGSILSTLVKRLIGALYEESAGSMDSRLNALYHRIATPQSIN